jgi:hypothetical protein
LASLRRLLTIFSNFSAHGVDLDEQWWPNTEHYFQAQKFLNEADRRDILVAPSPKEARPTRVPATCSALAPYSPRPRSQGQRDNLARSIQRSRVCQVHERV